MSYQNSDAPPPAYDEAVSTGNTSRRYADDKSAGAATQHYPADNKSSGPDPSRLQPHNGIPPQVRRSMEDEQRPLPPGWIRQFDPKSQHQFFVDTRSNPPRTIWQHPYDDLEFLKTLSHEERDRVQNVHKPPPANYHAGSYDDDDHQGQQGYTHLPNVPQQAPSSQKETFGQKMKDKFTGSTHAQREAQRQKEAEAEQQAYQRHQMIRNAMSRAIQTGEPQLIGKDKDGHDIYVEPQGGVTNGSPVYSNPNARFIRPETGYSRPYGYGYGGGLGMPLMGGLAGGLLLGDMLGGGFGYGMGGMGMMGMGGMGMGGMGMGMGGMGGMGL